MKRYIQSAIVLSSFLSTGISYASEIETQQTTSSQPALESTVTTENPAYFTIINETPELFTFSLKFSLWNFSAYEKEKGYWENFKVWPFTRNIAQNSTCSISKSEYIIYKQSLDFYIEQFPKHKNFICEIMLFKGNHASYRTIEINVDNFELGESHSIIPNKIYRLLPSKKDVRSFKVRNV